MKLVMMLMMFVISSAAFAGNELPSNSPTAPDTGAVEDSTKLVLLANALLNASIQPQLREFANIASFVQDVRIEIYEDRDVIVLEGMILRGGDMACGNASLQIEKTTESGFGWQPITRYTAQVSKNEFCAF